MRIAIFGKAILLKVVVQSMHIAFYIVEILLRLLQSNLQSGVIALLCVMNFIGEQSENYRSSGFGSL